MKHTDIAVIGAACNLPQASNIREFWHLILSGETSISNQYGDPQNLPDFLTKSGEYIPIASNLPASEIESFDADFWGISPKEAMLMDPQHKKALECAWHALEDACVVSDINRRIGVYGSSSVSNYINHNIAAHPDIIETVGLYQLLLGNCPEFLASRISYKLGLEGPALSFHSACSSSLVALHYACLDLANNQCDIALVVSASIRLPHSLGYVYEESGIFSKQGRCLPFDARADGTVPGSGVVALVLKRVDSASDKKRQVYARIVGSAVNNDGRDKVGYTAPSFLSQVSLYKSALFNAETSPKTISYIETHGTGTRIGDPIEFTSLNEVYGANPVALGTLKAQLGHLDVASGLVGVLKLSLMLYHNIIPPTAHIEQINPLLSDVTSNLYFPKEVGHFPSTKAFVAISSFGLGGTNSHFILGRDATSSIDVTPQKSTGNVFYTIPISAKSVFSLRQSIKSLHSFLITNTNIDIEALAYSLWEGRTHFQYRRIFIARTIEELCLDLYDILHHTDDTVSLVEEKFCVVYDDSDNSSYQLPYVLSQISNCLEEIVSIPQVLCLIKEMTSIDCIPLNDASSLLREALYLNRSTLLSGEFFSQLERFLFLYKKTKVSFLHMGKNRQLISLPTYSFQKQKHWLEGIKSESHSSSQSVTLYPSEYTEEALLCIWKEVLGIQSISSSDSFFEIGGDSLAAVRVLSILKKRYSIEKDLNFFLETDTIKSFFEQTSGRTADLITNTNIGIVNFAEMTASTEHLIILLPPAGGSLICYRDLVKFLCNRNDIAIVGIQYPETLSYSPTITDIANKYSETLKCYVKNVSQCKYTEMHIIGYSFGGNVGVEMCRILQQDKIRTSLYLIDSHPPKAYSNNVLNPDKFVLGFSMIIAQVFKLNPEEQRKFLSEDEMLAYYSEFLKRNQGIEYNDFLSLYKIWKQNHYSLRGYIQESVTLPNFTVFNAKEQEDEAILNALSIFKVSKGDWSSIVKSDNFCIIDVEGNHYTVLDKENVLVIANTILERL